MIIRIKRLRLRTIIGCNDWEREKKQDVVINVSMETDDESAVKSDDLKDSIDYRETAKRIITEVEKSEFFLLEKLAGFILDMVMENPRVRSATVEVDKPHALRFSESVSLELSAKR
ncbi:MAG: dihydroneopterin triphosphate 2'-epimerase [Thermodesulfobacteriota bacterium]|nr:MAG: dihydroneopterin triphosphate 2'-epimerase [Thermodesulfobacteriota bacterium]